MYIYIYIYMYLCRDANVNVRLYIYIYIASPNLTWLHERMPVLELTHLSLHVSICIQQYNIMGEPECKYINTHIYICISLHI